MVRRKWFWIIAYALPFIFYFIPMLRFTPEWKENRFVLYWILLFLLVSIFAFLIIRLWITLRDVTRSKKLVVTITTPLVIALHCFLFWITDLQYHFSMGSETVHYTEDINGRKIYIIEYTGLFNAHLNSEIGYSSKFLPLYYPHYNTANHLKLEKINHSKVTFIEYENIEIKREVKDVYDLFKKNGKEERPIRTFVIDIDNINSK